MAFSLEAKNGIKTKFCKVLGGSMANSFLGVKVSVRERGALNG